MANPALRIVITADASQLEAGIARVTGTIRGLGAAASEAAGGTDSLAMSFLKGQIGADALRSAFQKLIDIGRQTVNTYLEISKAARTLESATGDGAASLDYVRKIARDLGLDLSSTAGAFGKLAASAKGTSLQGQETRNIFEAVAKASVVMGLSADETEGALNAIGQMMSKGKVQAEELRGQLGERLPGAFGLAAKAMGVTTQQLDKLLVDGKVIAEDFLPKFARVLTESLGDAPAAASQSLQSSIGRMSTAWTEFLLALGQTGIIDAVTAAVAGLTKALQFLASDGIRMVTDVLGNPVVQITALALAINSLLVPAIISSLIPALRTLVLTFAIAGPVQGATLALGALGRSVMGLIGPWGLALGAIVAAGVALQRWATSYQRESAAMAEASAQLRSEATQATRAFVDQEKKVSALEDALRKTSEGSREHTAAGRQLNSITKELIATYPGLLTYLKREGDHYTNTSEAMRKYAASKLRLLQSELQDEKAAEAASRGDQAQALQGSYRTPIVGEVLNFAEWVMVGKTIATDAEREAAAHGKSAKEIQKQIDILKTWDSGTPGASPLTPDKPKKIDIVTEAEHQARLLRLKAETLAVSQKENLAAMEAAKLADIAADHAQALNKLREERAAKKLTPAQFDEEEKALGAKRLARLDALNDEILDKTRKANEKLTAEFFKAEDARAEAYKKGVSNIKEELAQLAQVKGAALSIQEINDALARYTAAGGEAARAAAQVRQDLRLDATWSQGAMAGLQEFIVQSQNQFQTWKTAVGSIMQGLTSSVAGFFESLTQKGMTMGQRLDALWKGIASSIVKALAQMAAQWLVSSLAAAIFGKSQKVAAASTAVAAESQAAAEIYAAHAWIPFTGVGIAAGMVAAMQAGLIANLAASTARNTAAVAFASGGIIDRPTLALMGEAGRELVVPEVSFSKWAGNLASNLLANERQVQAYGRQASTYARGLDQQQPTTINDLRGAVIVADERTLAQLHSNGRRALGSLQG